MGEFLTVGAVSLACLGFIWFRLWRTNAVIPPTAEEPLGARARLQFALDNGLPLKTSIGETDGRNVWNYTGKGGLRVPGDLCGGERKPRFSEGRRGGLLG